MKPLHIIGLAAYLSLVTTVSNGCASDEPTGPAPITRACYRSFAPTLDAWQGALLRVPEECTLLDQEYTVSQVLSESIPCRPASSSEVVVGCTVPRTQDIYLLAGRDDLATTDSSVHEWIHALADCVSGDADYDHLRASLWAEYGADTVEAQALGNVTTGECL